MNLICDLTYFHTSKWKHASRVKFWNKHSTNHDWMNPPPKKTIMTPGAFFPFPPLSASAGYWVLGAGKKSLSFYTTPFSVPTAFDLPALPAKSANQPFSVPPGKQARLPCRAWSVVWCRPCPVPGLSCHLGHSGTHLTDDCGLWGEGVLAKHPRSVSVGPARLCLSAVFFLSGFRRYNMYVRSIG